MLFNQSASRVSANSLAFDSVDWAIPTHRPRSLSASLRLIAFLVGQFYIDFLNPEKISTYAFLNLHAM